MKDEVYKVAKRFGLSTTVVANSWMRVPDDDAIELKVVGEGFDEADDWIVDNAQAHDVVITADIPLAARCLKKDAHAINPNGRVYTEESIGDALVSREIGAHLREHGHITGGPAPFGKRSRSEFLQALDRTLHAATRAARESPPSP